MVYRTGYIDRTLPGSEPAEADEYDSLNLVFIVAFAVLITVLARWLSTRGGKKK